MPHLMKQAILEPELETDGRKTGLFAFLVVWRTLSPLVHTRF